MQRLVGVILVLCLCSNVCRGEFILHFSPDGTVSNYNVTVGATVDIPIYLVETTTSQLSSRGMEFIGVRLQFSSGLGDATFVQAFINPLFSESVEVLSDAGFASVSGTIPTGDPIPMDSPLLLGTFRFQGNALNNVTTLSLADPNRFGDFTFDNVLAESGPLSSLGIDDQINFSQTITITAVPEPSSLLFGAFAASGIAASAWRRRKQRIKSSSTLELSH